MATRPTISRQNTRLCAFVFASTSLVMLVPAEVQSADRSVKTIYHPNPDHLWNRLHQALFLRFDKSGKVYGRDVVDPLLWKETRTFLQKGESHKKAIALLDEFVTKDGTSLIKNPLKHAVLQHDLWAIFDWASTIEKPRWLLNNYLSARQKAIRDRYLARQVLADHLARAIGLLALEDKTIANLPNNYQSAVASRSFATSYDVKSDRPFLPPDMFDPKGPWVCIRGAAEGPSAPVHMERFGGRSPFLVFLKTPGGRPAALDYIKRLNEDSAGAPKSRYAWEKKIPLFPVGTTVALVRRMNVINRQGKMVATPLVQTVQMRTYLRVSNSRSKADRSGSLAVFKFTLNRRDLFTNKAGGLVPVTPEKRAVIKLGSHLQDRDKWDRIEQGSGPTMHRVLNSCVKCHMGCGGGPNAKSLFTFNQIHWKKEIPGAGDLAYGDQQLLPTDIGTELDRAIHWKAQREEWRRLHRSLAKGTKGTKN